MAELTVGDVMQRDPVTISPDADLESLLRTLREHELPGLPVVNGDRLVGIVTESDLVLEGDDSSLHLPHYFELFGGVVFLEPLQHLEDRIRKAFANSVSGMMTTDVETISPDATVHEAAREDLQLRTQPPPRGRGPPPGRRRDTGRRPGSAHPRGLSMAAPARASQTTAAPGRAIAYVDAVAVERNCALLKQRLGAADLCAVVKADGYGHGATTCAAAAVAGGATWLAVATAQRGGGAAPRRRRGADPRDGSAHSPPSWSWRSRRMPTSWPGAKASPALRRRSRHRTTRAPAREARHGMGRLGTRDPEEASGSRRRAVDAGARAGRPDDPLRDRGRSASRRSSTSS